jgi:hypothetical protein
MAEIKPKRLYIMKNEHFCTYIKRSGKNKGRECGKRCLKMYRIGDDDVYRCASHNPMGMLNSSISGTRKYQEKRQQQIADYNNQKITS